jgi:hypothetical protein
MANIELDGANKTLKVDSGDLTLDIPGDIVLDADGGDVFVKDAGTTFGSLTNTSGNLIIKSGTTTAATFSGANVTLAGTVASGAITSSGIIKTDDATEATSTTDGSLQTDGGLSVVKDTVMGDDLKLLSDASVIHFGANSEITLTHSHDAGLNLKHTATADDKPVVLTLQTGETDIAQDDVIGAVNFQAPDEGTGTDAILVAAGIEAVSEGDFSSSNNATKLSFKTAASEAAAEKASLSSTGVFTATSFAGSGAGLTAGTTPLTTLDIDGGTDIGADIVDADLFIIDDGAGGTNRKTAASRLKTYVGGAGLVFIKRLTGDSNVSSLNFDDTMSATYSQYLLSVRTLGTTTDTGNIYVRVVDGSADVKDNGGYNWSRITMEAGNSTLSTGQGEGATEGYLATDMNNGSGTLMSGTYTMINRTFDDTARRFKCFGNVVQYDGTQSRFEQGTIGFEYASAVEVHGFYIYPQSGSLNYVDVALYGVKNS